MKIHDVEQGSLAWLSVRAGIPTCSEVGRLITPAKMEVSTGKGIESYVQEKLAERWLGRPLDDSRKTRDMDNGMVLESHAIPKFELETGLEVRRVGFITTDDGRFGGSPDLMLVDSIVGAEVKCPKPETHVGYLLEGELPPCYLGQVQGSMYLTGADHWYFLSYCPGFPELILKVERDAKYIAVLEKALWAFREKIERGWELLLKLNGGVMPVHAEITEEEAAGVVTRTMAGIDPASLDEFFGTRAYKHLDA